MTRTPPSPSDPIDPELLDRYFAGECTPLETATVAARLAAHPGWQRAADRLKDFSQPSAQSGLTTDDALARLRTRLAEPRSTISRTLTHHTTRRSRAAGVWWKSGSARRIAVIGAAIAVTLVAASQGLVRRWMTGLSPVPMQEYAVGAGEHATITLTDGTHVTLGPRSRLRYPTRFGNGARDVHLEGEGYFEITHDMRHPFTVYTDSSVVQELGTSFGVSAYPTDSVVHVVVADGRVVLRGRNGDPRSGTTLDRGDAGQIDRHGLTTVERNVNIGDALAWTHGRLMFDDATLADVAETLSRWYDVKVVFATPALANRHVTAAFDQEALTDVLSQLAEILRIRYTRNDRFVTIME